MVHKYRNRSLQTFKIKLLILLHKGLMTGKCQTVPELQVFGLCNFKILRRKSYEKSYCASIIIVLNMCINMVATLCGNFEESSWQFLVYIGQLCSCIQSYLCIESHSESKCGFTSKVQTIFFATASIYELFLRLEITFKESQWLHPVFWVKFYLRMDKYIENPSCNNSFPIRDLSSFLFLS